MRTGWRILRMNKITLKSMLKQAINIIEEYTIEKKLYEAKILDVQYILQNILMEIENE